MSVQHLSALRRLNSAQLCRFSSPLIAFQQQRGFKSQARIKKVNVEPVPFTPAFEERVGDWMRLLEEESDAIIDELPAGTMSVKYKDRERKPFTGHHLHFSWCEEELSENEHELLYSLRGREHVKLWPKSAEEIDSFSGKVVKRGDHFLEICLTTEEMHNPIISTHAKQFYTDCEWNLRLSTSNAFKRLLDLLRNRNRLAKCTGYPLMLSTYKVKNEEKEKHFKRDKVKKIEMATELNPAQAKAVAAAINVQRPIVAIHGPPGTGKTKVIAEIVYQVARKKCVLVCAPSHKAVDSAMQACAKRGLQNFVRVGDYADEDVLKEYRMESKAMADTEFRKLEEDIFRTRRIEDMPDFSKNEKRQYRLSSILKDSGKREDRIKQRIMSETKVVFCTCLSGQALEFIDRGWFEPDLLVMDEAAQVIECASWIYLLRTRRAVIAGDHHQLPPFVHSLSRSHRNAAKDSNSKSYSFLEYLEDNFGKEDIFHTLSVQYRSNELIQLWSNKMFYDNKLVANELVKGRHLRDLWTKENSSISHDSISCENGNVNKLISDPLVLIDTEKGISSDSWERLFNLFKLRWTQPLYFREGRNQNSSSIYNIGEALCATIHLYALHLLGGLSFDQFACITPYIAQTDKIRELLKFGDPTLSKKIGVSSVDAYQGQEREAIVMSFVRNNPRAEIGFLKEYRRLNVAITRAKRQFLLIASSKMLESDKKLWALYETIGANGQIIGPDEMLHSALAVSEALSRKKAEGEPQMETRISATLRPN